MPELIGLPPIIDKNTEILILGSFPGEESLRLGQYYANKRNQFWPIVLGLLEVGDKELTYDEKTAVLLQNKIGLWDVIHSCQRQGSLDSKIKCAQINDFKKLFSKYPRIKKILLNGKLAHKNFSAVGECMEGEYLMSSSPAHAVGLKVKMESWGEKLLK